MSWFEYGSLPLKKRRLRKGVWLRVRNLPASIMAEARKKMRSKDEEIDWVVVQEMKPDSQVLLEFWCHTPGRKDRFKDGSCRYTVFHVLAKEDPAWICEGDLGRGYKE
jgi:hypothetical protein